MIDTHLDHVEFETFKLYKIPKMVDDNHIDHYYYFKFGAEDENCIYGTCLGFNNNTFHWEFERYPDKVKVHMTQSSADMAFHDGIIEYNSEEEMIMDKIK